MLENLPEVLTVGEVAAVLRISKAHAYEQMREGAIPSLKVGRRRLVPKRIVAALLAGVTGPEGQQ